MNHYIFCLLTLIQLSLPAIPDNKSDLLFPDLATRWDEAVPLGNGMMGALIWKEGDIVRFSLDRADLWDNRTVESFQKPECNFNWVYERIIKGDVKSVQDLIDKPYDRDAAPTKIPAGRLEFNAASWGKVKQVRLEMVSALCTVQWESGVECRTFIHATQPIGWFRITGIRKDIRPKIIPPPFGDEKQPAEENVNSLNTPSLRRLGYTAPVETDGENWCSYRQTGWGGFEFAIYCSWRKVSADTLEGVWSIQSNVDKQAPSESARLAVQDALARSYTSDWQSHQQYWKSYWEQSAISLPDPVIETQWVREQYKFGAAARRGAPPISLQAVWTADEQRIPPWRGDYHHDLNTQLSYWPCYSANHLEEGLSYLDWLWQVKPTAQAWTRKYYQLDGLNFPGVSSILGEPLGGWHQYSCSPTTAAWLAQHFYLHWRYSLDQDFLAQRAYPWIREAAIFLEQHSKKSANGKRSLPLSSSPEINNNQLDAWFRETTNFDLALIRWLFSAAVETAAALGKSDESKHWQAILDEWPNFALSPDDGRLLIAPNYPLRESHRHFSHLMAIHPLGLIDPIHGEKDQKIIEGALAELDRLGPDYWCGYSYSWLANLCARAGKGEKAAAALHTFAECFCSPNTFHLNGDQTKSGKSKMTYRPFTLEGNFAFAAGVQEMLLQSQGGIIRIFPAVPKAWDKVAFSTLRAEGAYLISAKQEGGIIREVELISEKGGTARLLNPFGEADFATTGIQKSAIKKTDKIWEIPTKAGDKIQLKMIP